MRMPLGLAVTVALTTPLPAQAPRAASVPAPVLIKAGRLIDRRSDAAQSNVGIVVEGERSNQRGHSRGGGPGPADFPPPPAGGPGGGCPGGCRGGGGGGPPGGGGGGGGGGAPAAGGGGGGPPAPAG